MSIFWLKESNNEVSFGFTKEFLEKSGDICHIYNIKNRVAKNKPFLVIESTEDQISIDSPITGRLSYMNNKAISFPCLLKEDDVVAILVKETKETTTTVSFDEATTVNVEPPRPRVIPHAMELGDLIRAGNFDAAAAMFPHLREGQR